MEGIKLTLKKSRMSLNCEFWNACQVFCTIARTVLRFMDNHEIGRYVSYTHHTTSFRFLWLQFVSTNINKIVWIYCFDQCCIKRKCDTKNKINFLYCFSFFVTNFCFVRFKKKMIWWMYLLTVLKYL